VELLDHLIEWDYLYLRVRGAKLHQMVSELLRTKQLPVSDLRFEFLEDELQLSARIQKGIAIPVKLTVRTIRVVGKSLQVPLENLATFGLIPIPKLLFRIIGTQGLPDGIQLDAETLTVTVSLERFLPPFVDLNIESVRIVSGGLVVHVGRGGADLPSAIPLSMNGY
jgi:hypothetical protein